MKKLLLSIAAILSISSPLAWSRMPCYEETDVVGGELRLITTRHPNGTRIEAVQLIARPGSCMNLDLLSGRRADIDFRTVHLTSENPTIRARLREAVGHVIWVRSRDVMEPHSAWHQGDLVMFNIEVLAIDPL